MGVSGETQKAKELVQGQKSVSSLEPGVVAGPLGGEHTAQRQQTCVGGEGVHMCINPYKHCWPAGQPGDPTR